MPQKIKFPIIVPEPESSLKLQSEPRLAVHEEEDEMDEEIQDVEEEIIVCEKVKNDEHMVV